MWITLAGALLPASAQERSVRVAGVVQWMSTDKMMVIPNDGGLPIEVDITQVSQSQYEYLAAGSPVTVVGIVSPDGRRVIATTLIPGPGG